MQKSLDLNRGDATTKHVVPARTLQILDELGGQSCIVCGCRHYRLLLRARARSKDASLVARCSGCGSEIRDYSLERLCEDMNRCMDRNRGTLHRYSQR